MLQLTAFIGFLIATVVVLALIIWGLIEIFTPQSLTETDVQVVQRQLRGFALVLLAPISFLLIALVCGIIFSFFFSFFFPSNLNL